MAEYLTRRELRNRIARLIRDNKQAKASIINELINTVYLNEIMVCDDLKPLHWMLDFDDSLAAVAPRTITAITQADPGVLTLDAVHNLVANDIVGVYDIVGMTTLNNRIYKVNSVPSTSSLSLIDLDGYDAIDTTALTAYSSGGKVVHRGKTLATADKNVGSIESVSWHDEGKLDEITHQEAEKDTKWWNNTTTRPSRYMHRKAYTGAGVETNQLLWFPGSDGAYDMRYWFEERAQRMEADGNVPRFPHHMHSTIVSGVIARLAESNVEIENPSIWPTLYLSQLDALRHINRKWFLENPEWQRTKAFMQ